MRTTSILRHFLFFCLIAGWSSAYSGSLPWPLKGEIDLASGFGDFRTGRFHAGLDIRTGGVAGKELYSPVNGYVERVRMSYYGYGKGLYLKGDDGRIYVFGHLSRFNDSLDRRVKLSQAAAKRYYVDLSFPADSVRVRAGQLLAFTGQTGAGAPHLHMEQRTAGNFPIDPLTHGFKLPDKTKPIITRLGFQQVDDHSLFEDGTRLLYYDINPAKKPGKYMLRQTLYLNSPFGMLVECSDRMRPGGMKQAVYRLSVYIDGKLFYEVVLDTLDYATGRTANLEYDFAEAVTGDAQVRRLFRETGDNFAGSRPADANAGVYGSGERAALGSHDAKIVAEDAAGNKSELTFRFIWGPEGNLFRLDSSQVINATTTNFFFTPAADWSRLGVDSVGVLVNQQQIWGRASTAWITRQGDGRLLVKVEGRAISAAVLKLGGYTGGGGQFSDCVFSGIRDIGVAHISVKSGAVGDGILITAETATGRASKCRFELYYRGRLLGTEYPQQFFNSQQYRCFIPPKTQYAHIDAIGAVMSQDTSAHVIVYDSTTYTLVGLDSAETATTDSLFTLHTGKSDLFRPSYVAVRKRAVENKGLLNLASENYELLPQALVTRQDAEITLRPSVLTNVLNKSGLCRLDDTGERWIWLGGMGPDSLLHGKAATGGSYAAVFDIEPPTIASLNLTDFEIVKDRRPAFHFVLKDNLSGFEDDRNIVIKLDSQWMIPEYDPESGICQTQSLDSLAAGEHLLSIEVKDRAGNEAQRYVKFRTPMGPQAPQKKK